MGKSKGNDMERQRRIRLKMLDADLGLKIRFKRYRCSG
jgi:hypothetical protein